MTNLIENLNRKIRKQTRSKM
ncbi:hypothetical protein [Ornithobacterium rhinotracheale]